MDELIVIAWLLLALASASMIGAPLFMWYRTWPEAKSRWLSHAVGTESAPHSQPRDVTAPRARGGGPPMSVRLAALGSWILGSLFVPGVPMCVGGFFLMFVGLFVVPALFLAWRSFFLGHPLLMGELSSVRRARVQALITVLINGVTLATVVWWVVVSMPDFQRCRTYTSVWQFFGVAIVVAVHVGASLLHAALLVRAAKVIEALHATPAGAPAEGTAPR